MTISELLTLLSREKIVVVMEQLFIDKTIYLLGYAPFDPSARNYPLDATDKTRIVTDIEFDAIKRWFPALS